MKIKRAIVSVTDKTGIVEFCRGLTGLGVEIISTGGTAKALREAGLSVTEVADVTGFPEMLDGRLKTLHPKVHGGILAERSKLGHMEDIAKWDIVPIDMVVCNLYQFAKAAVKEGLTLDELIESIDIGGPTMIRGAAKNWKDVAVVISPDQYEVVLEELQNNAGGLTQHTLFLLAKFAFFTTATYDSEISAVLAARDETGARFDMIRN